MILSVLIQPFLATSAHPLQTLSEEDQAAIEEVTKKALRKGQVPGVVILIGNRENVLYRRAFGHRAIKPKKERMTLDTLFDLASLTKVVATTTAVMQLVESGKIGLEDPVTKYWPELQGNGKEQIMLRHLLTHYSGFGPGLSLNPDWSGTEEGLKRIIEEKPYSPPGIQFTYSDINFQILGEVVERISGKSLAAYSDEHIFRPLGMKDTFFDPPSGVRDRIAPTLWNRAKGKMLRGTVHDGVAYRMGGVAGHAGLFSTADNLSIFARMILNGGSIENVKILEPSTVEKMTLPQSPPDRLPLKGLGWEVHVPFASNRDDLFPAGSFGHTGFTGTGIWIDPVSGTYVILLTSRLHPDGKGNAEPLRTQILSLVAEAIGRISAEQALERRPLLKNYYGEGSRKKVQTGLEVLAAGKFSPLAGLRVGLITNHSGVDSGGRRAIDILHRARGLNLTKIFTPEHGLSGRNEGKISHARDSLTGLPVYSLYGNVLKPSEKMLAGLDALVFDIQDMGVRFYTYITTLGYAMEAAAKKGIAFYVLDRPNPITGSVVQGPMMEKNFKSFTGYFPMPIRHGMTVGELAEMFNTENRIGAKLHVIKMAGYDRTIWYDETGLPWVNPSPNLQTLTEGTLYPGVAMVEGANVSVGRGTATPFELVGAPWIDADQLTQYLNGRRIPGVEFRRAQFVPDGDRFKNRECRGVRILLTDRQALNSPSLGIEIASALYRLYPKEFEIEKMLPLIGAPWLLDALKEKDPHFIVSQWQEPLETFRMLRAGYLLY
ncbi:MAG: serine hydrolase [Deltaproteobacteria bacterium RBG_16_50_11]|nr:MAG: serine hydrolase [Deltaproteobacteria bacterium RBG_16_50_11]